MILRRVIPFLLTLWALWFEAAGQTTVQSVDTIAQLTNLPPYAISSAGRAGVYVRGYARAGDDGGGMFFPRATNATVQTGLVLPTTVSTNRWVRDLQGQPVTPKMCGAVADGVTADDAAFATAKAYATANGIALRVTPGRYLVNNVITYNTNMYVIFDPGHEIIRPAGASNYTFRVEPASNPTFTQNLATDVREGNTSIYLVSTNGYAPGDWIVIGDQSTRDPGNTASDAPNQEIAQILRIETNRVDLVSHVRNDYRTSNTNQIARIGELTIRAYGPNITVTTNGTTAGGIFCNYVTGGLIHEPKIEGNYLPAIHFQRSTRVKVTDGHLRRGTGVEIGGIGYSYYASRSSDLITFENCVHEGNREAQVDSGASDIMWIGCRAIGPYDDGFNVHGQGCKRVKFLGCDVNESRGYGILVSFNGAHWSDSFVDIIGCRIRANLSAIYVDYSSGTNSHIRVLNNELQGQRYAIEVGRSGYGLEIGGNKCTAYGQSLTGSGMFLTNCVGANLYDNSFYGYLSTGVYLAPGSSNNVLRNTTLRGMTNNMAMEIAGNDNVIDGVVFQDSNGSSVKDTGAYNKWSRYDARNIPSGIGLWFDGATTPILDGFSFDNVASAILLTNLNRALLRNGKIVAATNSTNPLKDYANNTRLENVRFDGTLATNANDTAIYNVSGTNKSYVNVSFSPAGAFDNCIYSESGVTGLTILDSLFEDGCVARMIGGSGIITKLTVRNSTFRNTPAYPIRPNGGQDWTFTGNMFENTPVWAISTVNGATNVLIALNTFRGYSTTNATLFPNRSLVVESMNHYGSTPETFWSIPAITNGIPTSIPTNNVFFYAIRGASGVEVWGLRYDGVTITTNRLFPSGGTVTANGSTVVTNFYDAGYHSFNDAGGGNFNITHPDNSIVTNKLQTIEANSILGNNTGSTATPVAVPLGANLSIVGGALTASTGGTNAGTPLYVDTVGPLATANLSDGGDINFTASGTNVTGTVQADSVALATDTTGNYVATVAGTANKVNVSGSGSENAAVTITLSDTIDLGGHTSFEVPNSSAPTTDAFGEVAGDDNAWAASRGAVQFYDGTANTYLVGVLASDTPSNGQVPKWNTGGTITWEDDSTGGAASGTPLYVDTAGALSSANLSDNSDINFTATGTNITASIIKTNYESLNIGTLNLTNAYTALYINGQLVSPARITNNETAEAGRVLWLTNAAGDIRAYATNLPSGSGGGGLGTNLVLNGNLMQPAILTNNETGEAGRILWVTNASGHIRGYATNLPAGGGSGNGTNLFVGASTLVQPAHLVDSASVTWSVANGTNISATFSGVGSNTNGYLVRYSTNVANLTDNGEDHLFTVVIPANTFQADGDEVEWYIPGKFLNNSGSAGGYTWRFNYGGATVVYGALDNDFPNSSSALASEWRIRMKRKDSTTIQTIASHNVGSDSATFSTNNINTVVYDESETVSDLGSNDLTVDFSLQNSASHASLGHTLFGYTLVKIGSVGSGGGGASVSDAAYGSGWNGDTTTAPSKNAVYDELELRPTLAGNNAFSGSNYVPGLNIKGTYETNWPSYGVRRQTTRVEGIPYWDDLWIEGGLNSGSGGGSDSGGTGSANGGTLATDYVFGRPGAKIIRVNSTNDAPTFGWVTAFIATNTGPECFFGEATLRVRSLSVGTSEIQVRAGFFSGSSQTNIPNNSAICIYDTNRVGTAWGFLTSTNGTLGTITQSGTTVTADSWVRLGVALYADQSKGAVGYINGTPFATNTANLPNGQQIGFGVGVAQVSGAGTANMDVTLDKLELRYFSGQ